MNITTATPAEIDTKLAELSDSRAQAIARADAALATVHTKVGDRKGRHGYGLSHETAITQARHAIAADTLRRFDRDVVTSALATITEQSAIIDALDAEIEPLDAEYARRPWSRFIAVQDGHLHSGRHCAKGTIRVTTRIGWHPELSGKTEADAVAQLGPMLCTHCFPTAPVEYTVGKPQAARCEGSGHAPVPGSTISKRGKATGRCTGCNVVHPLTQYLLVKAHKPKA